MVWLLQEPEVRKKEMISRHFPLSPLRFLHLLINTCRRGGASSSSPLKSSRGFFLTKNDLADFSLKPYTIKEWRIPLHMGDLQTIDMFGLARQSIVWLVVAVRR